MTKKITLGALLIGLCIVFQSCGGVVAGMANRQIINEDTTEYVETKMQGFEQYDPTEAQKVEMRKIQLEYITELKENARKEKTGEVSNSASLKVMDWLSYKKEAQIIALLNKDQLRKFRLEGGGASEREHLKHRKRVAKMGYNVDNL